jgi:hypothetical protein
MGVVAVPAGGGGSRLRDIFLGAADRIDLLEDLNVLSCCLEEILVLNGEDIAPQFLLVVLGIVKFGLAQKHLATVFIARIGPIKLLLNLMTEDVVLEALLHVSLIDAFVVGSYQFYVVCQKQNVLVPFLVNQGLKIKEVSVNLLPN